MDCHALHFVAVGRGESLSSFLNHNARLVRQDLGASPSAADQKMQKVHFNAGKEKE